jgi:hypothetical protein
MKYKALFVILLTTILITPAFAFIHPPPPEIPCATFGVKIDGAWAYNMSDPYEFIEPEDHFCTNFTVEVWALNMTDLYGYEFKLSWSPSGYFKLLSWVVEDVWASQLLVINTTDYLSWFKVAAVAKAPSTGLNGDALLVTLTFHIYNDVCWPQGKVDGCFCLCCMKASDSCTKPIKLCNPICAYWEFIAKHPEVYIEPKEEINCVVGEMVTYEVWVHNITKMKSLHFQIRWKGNHIVNCKEDIWLRILNLTEVVINEDVFPKAKRATSNVVIFNNPANTTSKVTVDIVMKADFPLINGTFKAVDLIFEKMDPWWCGRQPEYDIDLKTHEMKPDNATTRLWFSEGYIDVMCPDLCHIYFGEKYVEETFALETEGISSIAEWTKDVKYSPCSAIHLFSYGTGAGAGQPRWARINITGIGLKLKQLNSMSWMVYTVSGYPANVEIRLDTDADGIEDLKLVGEYAYQPYVGPWVAAPNTYAWVVDLAPAPGTGGSQPYGHYQNNVVTMNNYYYPTYNTWLSTFQRTATEADPAWGTVTKVDDNTVFWKSPGFPGPFGPALGAYFGRLKDFKNTAVNEVGGPGALPVLGNADILEIDIVVYNWIGTANHEAYIDDIMINGKMYKRANELASYNEAKFTFMPVPGDLSGDGEVDILDLATIAGKYGLTWQCWYSLEKFKKAYYYDFNKDGIIDIFDIIVVSKNWERTCPF